MGDRRSVIVKADPRDQGVYLYTHWNGYRLAKIVQDTLKLRLRWGDPAYLARMLFCEMIHGDVFQETGFGISTKRGRTAGDYTYDIVVTCGPEPRQCHVRVGRKRWTFCQFIELEDKVIEGLV